MKYSLEYVFIYTKIALSVVNSHCTGELDCDFDSAPIDEKYCSSWWNLKGDHFDWIQNHGSTITNETGPDNDHTTGNGQYMYVDATENNDGEWARLQSIDVQWKQSTNMCFRFW